MKLTTWWCCISMQCQ